jgi:O-antigen ligase
MVSGSEPWGHGLGSTAPFLSSRYDTIRLVHNEYLRVLAEMGAGGLVAFLAAYGALGWKLTRLAWTAGPASKAAALGAASVAVFLVGSTAENTFELFALYSVFPWAFAGVALARSPSVMEA